MGGYEVYATYTSSFFEPGAFPVFLRQRFHLVLQVLSAEISAVARLLAVLSK